LATVHLTSRMAPLVANTLNGAQTQSLIAVVSQMQAGTLTEGQAINIIMRSIGVTRKEAKALLRGL
jgi:hypothetical protein